MQKTVESKKKIATVKSAELRSENSCELTGSSYKVTVESYWEAVAEYRRRSDDEILHCNNADVQ
jgi:hypothetical protein